MRTRTIILLFCAASLAACGSCDEPSDSNSGSGIDAGTTDGGDGGSNLEQPSCPVDPFEGSVGDWAVTVDEDGRWMIESSDGSQRIIGLPSCGAEEPPARLGTGHPDVRAGFGAFDIDPAAIDWEAVTGPLLVAQQDENVVIDWLDSEASLVFRPTDHGAIQIELETGSEATAGEFGWSCAADEAFFGLGAQTAGMNLRGRTFPMWVQEQGNGKFEPSRSYAFPLANRIEASYAPMGVLWSSTGYTGILGHDAYSEFDLCNVEDPIASDEAARLRSYPVLPSIAFVPGSTSIERMTNVTEFTGRLPSRPPDWTFGLWVNAVEGPERVEEVATTMRDSGIPTSAIWTEDWAGSAATATGFRLTYEWSWDPATYPDLPTRIDDLNARGFAFLGYFNPFVPNNVEHYDEGESAGHLIEDEDGETILFSDPAFRQSTLVDLTKPDAVDWLQTYQTTAIDDVGLDGWMADFAEWWPLEAVPTDYSSAWLYHNRYPLDWQRANRASFEASNARDWVYFARSGWASVNGGSSGVAPTMWGGDQNTDWERYDGFPSIAPIGANLGLAGVAIFGSDIAGYNSLGRPNTTKELYFRWASAGAFHPLMRTHHGGDACENWTFDSDLETLDHTARWATVHARLYPYFSGRLDEALSTGMPITRHPYLVAPEASWMWDDEADYEWFLGDDILIAPAFVERSTSRVVDLPSDGWWPLMGDAPVEATTSGSVVSVEVDTPVTEIPVFVRPGRGLLLLSQAPDTFYGTEDPGLTSLEDVGSDYTIALYPDPQGEVVVDEAGVALTALGVTSATTFEDAQLDGAPLPDCGPSITGSCREPDRVVLVDVTEADVAADGATFSITSASPVRIELAVGGAAFGDLAAIPPEPNLASDPPNWCEQLEF